ncbi:MAG: hypothetical protein ACPG4Z_06005 [Chitinophagales bacterium]
MKRISLFLLLSACLLTFSCEKDAITSARVSGVYNSFINSQADYYYKPLGVNFKSSDEIEAVCEWDGENEILIYIDIDDIKRRKIEFTIPEQLYIDDKNISGSGILYDESIEFTYIIKTNNVSRSYNLNGAK